MKNKNKGLKGRGKKGAETTPNEQQEQTKQRIQKTTKGGKAVTTTTNDEIRKQQQTQQMKKTTKKQNKEIQDPKQQNLKTLLERMTEKHKNKPRTTIPKRTTTTNL